MIDVKEYEKIVTQNITAIYKYCYSKTNKNKELTDETVNDVFKVLYQKWDKLNSKDNITAYLYRVADVCIKSALRKNMSYYTKVSSYDECVEKGMLDYMKHFDVYFEVKDIDEKINSIAKQIPNEYYEIFVLRYIEKLTLNEITLKTNIPYSTLRSRLIKLEEIIKSKIHNEI